MKYFFLSLIYLFVFDTADWGQKGHRVVGSVAEQYLSKKAKRAVNKLLDGQRLTYVSNFADDIKSDARYDSLYTWHYINIAKGKQYDPATANPKGDLVTGINYCISTLQNQQASHEERQVALKLLVHFVGDLHQPMHVGHPDNRGGNDIKLKWWGRNTNLHRVWDSDMINSYELSAAELTEKLPKPNARQVKQWQQDPMLQWVRESQLLADELYDNLPKGKSKEYRYRYKYFATAQERLLQGGVRLAGILNRVFQ